MRREEPYEGSWTNKQTTQVPLPARWLAGLSSPHYSSVFCFYVTRLTHVLCELTQVTHTLIKYKLSLLSLLTAFDFGRLTNWANQSGCLFRQVVVMKTKAGDKIIMGCWHWWPLQTLPVCLWTRAVLYQTKMFSSNTTSSAIPHYLLSAAQT